MIEIKIKLIDNSKELDILAKGDWIDLYTSKTLFFSGPTTKKQVVNFNYGMIPLGIAMQLPEHFEANIVPRSSTFMKYGLLQANSFGVIDHTYCGNNDEWKMPVVAFNPVEIHAGTRIAQFRIRPSQFAPMKVKLKWLFTNKIKFVYVDSLNNADRGGFGSTGTV